MPRLLFLTMTGGTGNYWPVTRRRYDYSKEIFTSSTGISARGFARTGIGEDVGRLRRDREFESGLLQR